MSEPLKPNDSPVAKLWQGLLREAVKQGFDQLHVDPHAPDGPVLRASRAGTWQELMPLPPKAFYEMFIRRLRVLANLNLVRSLAEEHGQLTIHFGGAEYRATVRVRAIGGSQEAWVRLYGPVNVSQAAT